MTRPLRIQYPGAFYYISNYGNSGTPLFKDDEDHKNFLIKLETSTENYSVILHGFVLLKDHFHLLAETPLGNLSEFMRHLNISYTSYFNRKHKRRGHLFGGRYKSIVFEKELYLTKISHYLHLNPIKTGALKRKDQKTRSTHLTSWKWSSLPGFTGLYPRYSFITHQVILDSFGGDTPEGRQKYADSIKSQLDKGFSFRSKVIGQTLLGSMPFIENLREILLSTPAARKQPQMTNITHYLRQEKILSELERTLRCDRNQLISSPGNLRSVTMDMLYRYGGLTNPEIGELMKLDYSSISLGRKKIQQSRRTDHSLNAKMTLLEKRLQRLWAEQAPAEAG